MISFNSQKATVPFYKIETVFGFKYLEFDFKFQNGIVEITSSKYLVEPQNLPEFPNVEKTVNGVLEVSFEDCSFRFSDDNYNLKIYFKNGIMDIAHIRAQNEGLVRIKYIYNSGNTIEKVFKFEY